MELAVRKVILLGALIVLSACQQAPNERKPISRTSAPDISDLGTVQTKGEDNRGLLQNATYQTSATGYAQSSDTTKPTEDSAAAAEVRDAAKAELTGTTASQPVKIGPPIRITGPDGTSPSSPSPSSPVPVSVTPLAAPNGFAARPQTGGQRYAEVEYANGRPAPTDTTVCNGDSCHPTPAPAPAPAPAPQFRPIPETQEAIQNPIKIAPPAQANTVVAPPAIAQPTPSSTPVAQTNPSIGANSTSGLDILLVIDSNPSLDGYRKKIAQQMYALIDSLPQGLSWKIAVLLANPDRTKPTSGSGVLFSANTNDSTVLANNALEVSQIKTILGQKINYTGTKIARDGSEAKGRSGLLSLQALVSNSNAINTYQNQNFFLSSSSLAVIFISAEDDICFTSKATADVVAAKTKFCASTGKFLTAQQVLEDVLRLKGNQPVTFSSVNLQKDGGAGYKDLVALQYNTNGLGLVIPLNVAGWGNSLSYVGSNRFAPYETFTPQALMPWRYKAQ